MNCVTQEKSSNFSHINKPAVNTEGNAVSKPNSKKLLTVAPSVLPLLPAVPRPPKLHQRSNTTFSGGVCGVPGEAEIKENNKDRITLDRRGLTSLPVLAADAQVKLLSLQHNLITRLDNISTIGLSKLVFLDVYDNQLDRIAGLDTLATLRVLLMGKNRIRRMEGLKNLVKLEVLDLHGNQISQVGGLANLCELKVLNLAGNQIRTIGPSDLQGLGALQELNLRRNRLKRLMCFGDTPQLQKLFLSNNEIQTIEDMSSVVKASQVREVSVDGNPIALVGDCVSFLVSYLPNLELLSQVQVSEQVRKAAMAWRVNKEQTCAAFSNLSAGITEEEESKREEVIYNARTNWELLRSQTTKSLLGRHSSSLRDLRSEEMVPPSDTLPLSARAVHLPERAQAKRTTYSQKRTTSQQVQEVESLPVTQTESVEFFRLPPILAPLLQKGEEAGESVSSVEPVADSSLSSLPDESTSESDGGKAGSKRGSRSSSVSQRKQILTQRTTTRPKPKPPPNPGKVREQGGDYLVEISGRYLNVYGQGALRFIDRPWNPVKAEDVINVRFNYVNFNSLCCVLGRLKHRFPNAEHFSFRETNIHCLGQLNALADIQGLTSLTIHTEGNPICSKEWRSYAIYRLSHWGLRNINDEEISVEDMTAATEEFRGLSELVLWSLPDSLLQPLLSRLRLETSQQSARHWLWNADPALRTVVAKEALQWRRANLSQEDMLWRHKGKAYLGTLLDQTCSAVIKLRMLDEQWSTILRELVRDTLVDYSTLDAYMKQCMNNLKL
ncbi:leucine-rich repeat-containing protein 49-like isoform X2 [Homalodisca vitripennis]|uniref:leucine-rich repeat-containing protein 49-like isoform X2 n=1 Tax=Homalodisca vitripennis TaxID=197043 RepID=UPI001EEC086D|nr:leucine-rich repeat-containing protein 49-like isoform X2 [Homalodisca vitripennis]